MPKLEKFVKFALAPQGKKNSASPWASTAIFMKKFGVYFTSTFFTVPSLIFTMFTPTWGALMARPSMV